VKETKQPMAEATGFPGGDGGGPMMDTTS